MDKKNPRKAYYGGEVKTFTRCEADLLINGETIYADTDGNFEILSPKVYYYDIESAKAAFNVKFGKKS